MLQILFAMSMIDLHEYKLFPSAVKNAIYFLKKRKLHNSVEQSVLTHFNRLPIEPNQTEVMSWLGQFKTEIENLDNDNQRYALSEHLPFLAWAEKVSKDLA